MTNKLFQKPELLDVKRMLSDTNLPTGDLADVNLDHFWACGETSNPKGIIGVEVYGKDGLLRSLAVAPGVQGQGCGSSLVTMLEDYAKSIGIEVLYLLTESAEKYFLSKGFDVIERDCASDAIKKTREFSELCPDNATLMRKFL